jgi:hypothetical protein
LIAAYARVNQYFTADHMTSKQNLSMLLISLVGLSISPGLQAAGKCADVRTESTFELINAPVEEMQNSRNSADANCVVVRDFIARSKAKPTMSNNVSTSTTRPAAPTNGSYVPKTKDDNTPWRFDMNQNGKRMTSVEFDAWMKAKGIRVATGKPGSENAPVAVDCKPIKEKAC